MFKTYEVAARLKFPSCFHNGYDFTVSAKNKTDAIKQARRMVHDEGHSGRVDGPISYSATEVQD